MCGYPTNGNQCLSTATARGVGKPLWASELGAIDGATGAANMARAEIRGYPNAGLTGFVTWPMIAAMPPGIPHQTQGLIYADQPWSGYYTVNAMTYAIAMISWFTAPGWHFVDGADGGLGGLTGVYADGSYATLKAPNGRDWSTIAETTTTTASPVRQLHGQRWAVGEHGPRLANEAELDEPGRLDGPAHAISTRSAASSPSACCPATCTRSRRSRSPGKGSSTAPAPGTLGSYTDNPTANPLDSTAGLPRADGRRLRIPALCRRCPPRRAPSRWRRSPRCTGYARAGFPYAVVGDPSWRDYTVSADVLFTQTGSSAGVLDRFSYQGSAISNFRGYILKLADDGSWQLLKNSRNVGVSVLASGTLTAPAGVGKLAHTCRSPSSGATLTAAIDASQVATVTDNDPNYTTGIAGIEAGAIDTDGAWTGTSWPIVQYRRPHRVLTALHTPLPKEATHLTAARRLCAPRDATALNPHCPCFAKPDPPPVAVCDSHRDQRRPGQRKRSLRKYRLNRAKDGSRGGQRAGAARFLVCRHCGHGSQTSDLGVRELRASTSPCDHIGAWGVVRLRETGDVRSRPLGARRSYGSRYRICVLAG